MKYLRIVNDKSNRLIFKHEELKKAILSLLNRPVYSSLVLYWKDRESKLFSITGIKNYCILSGRARGVFSEFKLSRILLRKFGSKGFLAGLKKKSW